MFELPEGEPSPGFPGEDLGGRGARPIEAMVQGRQGRLQQESTTDVGEAMGHEVPRDSAGLRVLRCVRLGSVDVRCPIQFLVVPFCFVRCRRSVRDALR